MSAPPRDAASVTGLGVISPIGVGLDAFSEALFAGRSAGRPVEGFDTREWRSLVSCPVSDFEPTDFMERRAAKRMDRAGHFGVAAARLAMRDAGLWKASATSPPALVGVAPERVAVVTGTCAPMEWVWTAHEACFTRGPRAVPPSTVLASFCDAAAAQIAIHIGAFGPCHTVSTACASGADALGLALWLLDSDQADVVIAGGVEAPIVPSTMIAFGQARALSERNDAPESASRPFAVDRDGFVMGEGAGLLVLERAAFARARGARVRATLASHAATCDAAHMTAPAEDGVQRARALRLALERAGLTPSDVGAVLAHGTGTPHNDVNETQVLHAVFGAHVGGLAVPALKSMVGHGLGAAAGLAAVAGVVCLEAQRLHPTLHLTDARLDPRCDLDYVRHGARPARLSHIALNAFGFGGKNACVVLSASR